MSEDFLTAGDGTRFVIQSEHVRGGRRVYWPMMRPPGGDWRELPEEWSRDSLDKRVIRRRIERYAGEHHAGVAR